MGLRLTGTVAGGIAAVGGFSVAVVALVVVIPVVVTLVVVAPVTVSGEAKGETCASTCPDCLLPANQAGGLTNAHHATIKKQQPKRI